MAKKSPKKSNSSVTINRRASYDYSLSDGLTVGLSLTGPEVRQIRDHHVQLKGSFVTLRNRELWLNNLLLLSAPNPPATFASSQLNVKSATSNAKKPLALLLSRPSSSLAGEKLSSLSPSEKGRKNMINAKLLKIAIFLAGDFNVRKNFPHSFFLERQRSPRRP